jgi:hypothetical protein
LPRPSLLHLSGAPQVEKSASLHTLPSCCAEKIYGWTIYAGALVRARSTWPHKICLHDAERSP